MSDIIDVSSFNKILKSNMDFKSVFLFGEEEYLIQSAINGMKKLYLTPEGEQMDCCTLDYDNKNVNVSDLLTDIESNLMIPPWMSKKRLVIVKNIDLFQYSSSDTELTDRGMSIVSNIPRESLLVFIAEKIDKRKKSVLNIFLKNGYVVEVNFMEEEKLNLYVKKQLSKEGITIDEASVSSLISRCDKRLRQVITEITKLTLYCEGKGIKNIDENLIEAMCPPDIRGTVFNITDAIGTGDVSQALKILDTLLKNLLVSKEPPIKIRAMFTKHIKQLICAKEIGNERDIISKMKVHPFVAKKINNQARNFTINFLLDLYARCAKVDADIKHGLMDERQGLELLIILSSNAR